jgi:hypothetical protein
VAFVWQDDQFGDAALACDRSIPAAARTQRECSDYYVTCSRHDVNEARAR